MSGCAVFALLVAASYAGAAMAAKIDDLAGDLYAFRLYPDPYSN